MNIKNSTPYLIAIFVFVGVSLAYFSPVLKGEKLFQSDIYQFKGMAKEIQDFRTEHGEEPYWTDAAFGGMPSYQLSTYYPNDYVKKLDSLIRFLPRPADYLFLYFLGFFILLLVLKFDWKLAMIGSLAFGFSTYFIIILGVGHNAKAHAIGYMPMVIAGFLWVFQKKYLKGFLLTTVAMALEINTSHPQMTYYLLFTLSIMSIVFLIDTIKRKEVLKPFFQSIGILFIAVVMALGANATSILATKEYADYSTRGKSELTISPDGKKKEASTGLSKEYITAYSIGKLETFSVFIPRFMGGGSVENLGEASNTYAFLSSKIEKRQAREFVKNVPTYWGEQPGVAAPPYIGAIFIFLFVLGLFLVEKKYKNWLAATTVFSIVLSWGHNFSIVTNFFIDYVPLYNKFRAISSIQVLAEIAVPLLGLLALKEFVFDDKTKEEKLEALKKSFYIVGGLALFFTLFGTSLFDFQRATQYDKMIEGFSDAIEADRRAIFFEDSLRTFLLILVVGGSLFIYLKGSMKQSFLLLIMGVLLLFDIVGVSRKYVNNDDFQKASKIEKPYVASAVDNEILKDKGHYRVANFAGNFMNDGGTSYFHKSIGGYHAAKPGRYQEIVDFHISKNNMEVLNMLNTKYFILSDDKGKKGIQVNPDINGNAWFVEHIKSVKTANEEILSLTGFNSKKTAVVNEIEFPNSMEQMNVVKQDSLAKIQQVSYAANAISYESKSNENQLAIFSEMYYKNGWNAYIDGVLTPHIRADYILRGLFIPKGKHRIEFKFEPTVISVGNTIGLISLGIFVLVFIGGFILLKKQKETVNV